LTRGFYAFKVQNSEILGTVSRAINTPLSGAGRRPPIFPLRYWSGHE